MGNDQYGSGHQPPPEQGDTAGRGESDWLLGLLTDAGFARVTALAARLTGAPMAAISIAADGRTLFRACHGIELPDPPGEAAYTYNAVFAPDSRSIVYTRTETPYYNGEFAKLWRHDLAAGTNTPLTEALVAFGLRPLSGVCRPRAPLARPGIVLPMLLTLRFRPYSGELTVEQFPHGHSNLTYLLKSGDQEWVLRRPPPRLGGAWLSKPRPTGSSFPRRS